MGPRVAPPGLVAVVATVALVSSSIPSGASLPRGNEAALGSFSRPFVEPDVAGTRADENCVEHEGPAGDEGHVECKPAAGSMAILPNGRVLYFNALEGTENIKNSTGGEFGRLSINDQTRVLDLDGPSWSRPSPVDGGANPGGNDNEELFPGSASTETYNDGALFCADLNHLPDGRLLATGGTSYYDEAGSAELEGLANARIYDPASNTWTQTGSMKHGRWYPTMLTLGNGDIFVASGVKKLIKPLYPSRPLDSGANERRTETYDPLTGKWRDNGPTAARSLPLFPRLHLLPNGDVYYNAGGQAFNPFGQSYDEATWNLAAAYDPKKKEWTSLGVPGLGSLAPGFRGSTFSMMLPLRPNEKGNYSKAEFLSAGGVFGTTPGSYVSVPFSAITTVDTAAGSALSTRTTGDLTQARWYSTGVLLPTGEAIAFSGADRDEVVGPGTGFPVTHAELFDPKSEEWRPLANAHRARVYHNTAALLPDGRVLVGGHAPIPTAYGAHGTLPGGFSPNEGRDPTFEIYSPPYLFRGPRAEIVHAPDGIGYGGRATIITDVDASEIKSVVLVRNPTITHLVDADQRNVELPIVARHGRTVTVAAPPNGNVAPPGPYMLFVNAEHEDGPVPSVAQQVLVGPAAD